MTDARVMKLRHKIDEELAEKLVAAGFDTPRKIKAATDKDLRAIKGVGAASVASLRKRFRMVEK